MLYGGDEHTLHNIYGIPLGEAKRIVEIYYERFPEILVYQQDTFDFAQRNGYVESPFGRRLYLPYIKDRDPKRVADARRTAINMPIQGTASDILLCAKVVAYSHMTERRMRSMIVNTVHDSMVLDVYPGELEELIVMFKNAMENVKSYAPTFFPHLDFGWLCVPLKAEVEVGSHYGAMKELEHDSRW